MIKVFLVEDEIAIRSGIKNSIHWEEEGYEFTGEASDGELAYPMILKERPDILITDIKMPFMDGLELSRLVRRELPDIKILILSGYDEFEYAKEAIKVGVTEYLLKPISSAKLLQVLGEVRDIVLQEREEKELLRRYSEEMKENTEHEKMKFFSRLAAGNLSTSEVIDTGKQYGMNLSAQAYGIVLFKILSSGDRSVRLGEAYKAVEDVALESPDINSFQRGVDGWAFLITGESEEEIKRTIKDFIVQLKQLMSKWKDIEYFGGTGSVVTRLSEMRESFREAEKVFAGRFTHEPNQILFAGSSQEMQEVDSFSMQEFGEIKRNRGLIEKFLNNGTQEEIESFADAYVQEITTDNLRSTLMRQYIIMDIYIVIMAFCEKLKEADDKLRKEAEGLKEALKRIQTQEGVKAYMIRLLSWAIDTRDTVSGRRYSDIIKTAQEQIARTYMSEDISLNTVAVSVGMSPSYFSTVFSREVGKTFVEYLTETRMDKAKELLMCSSMKTSEVGYEVGYRDPHYFSYIFKKTQGCSPKEYRARRKEQ